MQEPGPTPAIMTDAVCWACGCLCDDITVHLRGPRIEKADQACALGEAWFVGHTPDDGADCRVAGQEATVADGLARAAAILRSARHPLVCGLCESATESQRLAAAIADWIGGCLDTASGFEPLPIGSTLPGSSMVTATLGEVRHRADLIVLWGTDPARTHPRHFQRYSLEPKGQFVPNGRSDRYCVVVDGSRTDSARAADIFLQIKRSGNFEAIWTLRALAQDIPLDRKQVRQQTGVPLSQWQDLIQRMKSARYGVLFYGAEVGLEDGHSACGDALAALVRDLNRHTRFVAIPNRGHGNSVGAENAMAWRTGYPAAVSFARGYPRSHLREYSTAALLERAEVDAALVIASDPLAELSPAARNHLQRIPFVAIDWRETRTTRHAAVAFRVAMDGIHVPGTVYRMDQVPLWARATLTSRHSSTLAILQGLEALVRCR